MSRTTLWAALNIFTHELIGPFASQREALTYIGTLDDATGVAALPFSEPDRNSVEVEALRLAREYPEKKIQAIKELRTSHDLTLKDAKEAMEDAYRQTKIV